MNKLSSEDTLVFASHPKCAGTWFSGFFLTVCTRLGIDRHYARMVSIEEHLQAHADRTGSRCYISQSSSYDKLTELRNYKAIHVIRDPRDIVVSGYYSFKKTHFVGGWKELQEIRDKLQECSMDEGLYLVMDFLKKDFERMGTWNYQDPHVLEVKLEDFMMEPEKILIESMQYLGLCREDDGLPAFALRTTLNRLFKKAKLSPPFRLSHFSREQLMALYDQMKFSKQTKGRKPGEESEDSHMRKGVSGDWKNHFSTEHSEYFNDRYPGLIGKLGYG